MLFPSYKTKVFVRLLRSLLRNIKATFHIRYFSIHRFFHANHWVAFSHSKEIRSSRFSFLSPPYSFCLCSPCPSFESARPHFPFFALPSDRRPDPIMHPLRMITHSFTFVFRSLFHLIATVKLGPYQRLRIITRPAELATSYDRHEPLESCPDRCKSANRFALQDKPSNDDHAIDRISTQSVPLWIRTIIVSMIALQHFYCHHDQDSTHSAEKTNGHQKQTKHDTIQLEKFFFFSNQNFSFNSI